MANKSNLNCVIDNGSGVTLAVQDDASGYLLLTMSDSKDSKSMKLASADFHILKQIAVFSEAIRLTIPQS